MSQESFSGPCNSNAFKENILQVPRGNPFKSMIKKPMPQKCIVSIQLEDFQKAPAANLEDLSDHSDTDNESILDPTGGQYIETTS